MQMRAHHEQRLARLRVAQRLSQRYPVVRGDAKNDGGWGPAGEKRERRQKMP
eukprot:CAMPEP_0115357770 /NCGR_PEP_ID=MMETSP0270-20121206/100316_1 /TAXON_ID=71861 /ORGANISM="Scrippsiella trochoidea, Strain CCMP3099" /LENGTH=51 /DNA_ID=CAMNT_0002780231 /DNA_START=20 /DNA_END=173 /DNA_ORIENTATION=-